MADQNSPGPDLNNETPRPASQSRPAVSSNPVFKSQMGAVSFAVLGIAVFALAALFVMAFLNLFGPPSGEMPDFENLVAQKTELYWPWDAFVWLVASGGLLSKIIALATAILSVGIGVIAKDTTSKWLAQAVIWLCLSGTVLAILMMWQLSGEPDFGMLRSPSNMDDAAFKANLYGMLGLIAGWFLVFLGRQVGVGDTMGLMKELWKRWTGGDA
uniref:hypothetical protein n=1 Tax=Parerythrobacter lutipelagi TaxID=1964208 RepID=UPI0010FA0C80|nr:hypothetical protein [Parerythrobacter lutipelagi]